MKKLLIFVAIALLVLGTAIADRQQRENREDREASSLASPAAAPANPPGDKCKSNADCNKGQVCCGSDTDKAGMCLGDEDACNTTGPKRHCGNDKQCDDNNPCTSDKCDKRTRLGHCVNNPVKEGIRCPDGKCDGSGNCVSDGVGCLPPSYPCDYGYECCSYYCSGGSNGVCISDTDCPGYDAGEQVCCNYICQQSCGSGSNSGSSGSVRLAPKHRASGSYAGTCALVGHH